MGVPAIIGTYSWMLTFGLSPTAAVLLPDGSTLVCGLQNSGSSLQTLTQRFDSQADPMGPTRTILSSKTVDYTPGVFVAPLPGDGFSVVFLNRITPHQSAWMWEAGHGYGGFYFGNPSRLDASATGAAPLLVPTGSATVGEIFTHAYGDGGTAVFERSYTLATGVAGKIAPVTGKLAGTISDLVAAPIGTGQTALAWLWAPGAAPAKQVVQVQLLNADGTVAGKPMIAATGDSAHPIGRIALTGGPGASAELTYTAPAGVFHARQVNAAGGLAPSFVLKAPGSFGITPQAILDDGSLLLGRVTDGQALASKVLQVSPAGSALSVVPVGPGASFFAAAPGGDRALLSFLDLTGMPHTYAVQYADGASRVPPVVAVTAQTSDSQDVFTITLSAALPYNVTIGYHTADGTAIAGVDYTKTIGTVTIAAGSTQAVVTVPLLSAALMHPTATFAFTASGNLGGAGGAIVLVDDTVVGALPSKN